MGANVQAFRVNAGLTQQQLAEKAEVDLRFLQRIERGSGVPSFPTVIGIADALACIVGDLFRPAVPTPARRGRPRQRAVDPPE